jgi:GNAT superfamily N-acetyltransferase
MPYAEQLDAELERRGWVSYNPTLVVVADLGELLMAVPSREELPRVRLTTEPSTAWLQTYNYRGEALPPVAREVMVNADQPLFASIADPDVSAEDPEHESLLAVARGAVDQGWLGITAVDVIESARRRGLASHLMRALFEHAQIRGVRHVYLQVTEENLPAQTLYGRMGFTIHHRYHYRRG